MHPHRSEPADAAAPLVTANERLKQHARLWQAHALVVAVAAHFAALALWPEMTVAFPTGAPRDTLIFIIPKPEQPEPPPEIARPAPPKFVAGMADFDVTIPSLSEWSKPRPITPPPAARGEDATKFHHFVHSMIPPRVLNQREVEQALARHYPAMLRDAGIGGDVSVLLWLDEEGTIVRAAVGESSGREALDQAALEVVKVMRLTPALNMNRPTRVIVSLPVKFIAH